MIVIVSSVEDTHALCVAKELRAHGEQTVIVDTAKLACEGTLSYPIGSRRETGRLKTRNEHEIEFEAIKSLWYRRPHVVDLPFEVSDPGDRAFAAREWWETLEGILLSLGSKCVNPFLGQISAVKPRQLEIAQSIGFRIPETLVTNNPCAAEEFIIRHGNRAIHKALTAPNHHLIDTRRWEEADRSLLVDLPLAPTIFQEEIFGPADVRVTMVGDDIFAARIETSQAVSGIDSRLELDIPYVPHTLPAEIEDLLLRLMQTLGLKFGTVDLKITKEDDYVFLEVNPQGQFLYVEILTGLPITASVAKMLAQP